MGAMQANLSAWRERSGAPRLRCARGTLRDYELLAPLHYRAGPPATIDRVVRSIDEEHNELAGVLVTSRPTLNGAWRRAAWGARFASGDRSEDARSINRDLRTISRVIVDPRFRGLGVGHALVRWYLAQAVTPCTEAVTAMGPRCGFFLRAGMRPIALPMPARHARLVRALGAESAALAARSLLDGHAPPKTERALRVWARSSAATRRIADAPLRELAAAAAGALIAPPIAYAHG